MKNQKLRISLLSLLLLALWTIIFFSASNAANVTLSLTINGGSVSCSNEATLTLTALNTSSSAQSQTWTFTASSWTCTDLKWTGWTNNFTVISSALTGGWNSIAATNIRMSTTISTTLGNLTGTTALASFTDLSVTRDLYSKTVIRNIGTFVATPSIAVSVPARQQPATYTATITVTYPPA